MGENVTVVRHSQDRLTQWVWRFWFHDHTLWLDGYEELQRPSRRHGFSATQTYQRIMSRGNTLDESDVVLRADVIQEAITKFCEGITVKRWSDRTGCAGKE